MSRQLYKLLPELKTTSDFSKFVAKILFRKRNRWSPLFKVETYQNGVPYLVVQIPSPVQSPERDMILIADEDQITIVPQNGNPHHAHFAEWDKYTLGEVVDMALKYIDEFVNEDAVFVAIRQVIAQSNQPYISGFTCYLTNLDEALSRHDVLYVHSWKGTYDKDFSEN